MKKSDQEKLEAIRKYTEAINKELEHNIDDFEEKSEGGYFDDKDAEESEEEASIEYSNSQAAHNVSSSILDILNS